jgi:hypothetical protein
MTRRTWVLTSGLALQDAARYGLDPPTARLDLDRSRIPSNNGIVYGFVPGVCSDLIPA